MPKPVIIDCDPGHDDAMALMLAVASPELELVAVTTVAGNQTLEKVTANAIRVLDVVEAHDIPVAAGADRGLIHTAELRQRGPRRDRAGRPGPAAAVTRARAAARRRADGAEAARAPADADPDRAADEHRAAARHAPRAHGQIERIVIMGGAIGLGNVTPSAEFNVWADPEAAHRVFTSGLDITMVGLDVTHRAMLSAERADALRDTGRAGAVVADLHALLPPVPPARLRPQRHAGPRRAGRRPRDPARRDLHRAPAGRDRHHAGPVPGPDRRRSAQRTGTAPNAHVATDVEAAAFIDLLTGRISALP